MRLSIFGPDFLSRLVSGRVTPRRWRRVLAAAQARWPGGFVEIDRAGRQVRYMAPNRQFPENGPLCGVLLCW